MNSDTPRPFRNPEQTGRALAERRTQYANRTEVVVKYPACGLAIDRRQCSIGIRRMRPRSPTVGRTALAKSSYFTLTASL